MLSSLNYKQLHNLIIGNRSFAVDVLKLASGTALIQILMVLAGPILTRLYNPESFGSFALFTSIVSVTSIIACLRYELAIMLPKKESDAANLLGLSLLLAVLISILVTISFGIFKYFSIFSNIFDAHSYFWLVPISMFMGGVFSALSYWISRARCFGYLSIVKISSSATTIGIQLAAGFSGHANDIFLISASVVGAAISVLLLGIKIWQRDGNYLRSSLNLESVFRVSKKYRNFPLYDTWAALLNSISSQMPVFLLSFFFSTTEVGYYALGTMAILLPLSIISGSIGQVFFQRASELKFQGKLGIVIENMILHLIIISLYPILLLFLLGEDIFIVVFGEQWAVAGIYTQILTPWMFCVFIVSPISFLYNILGKQHILLLLNIILLLARVASLTIGGFLANVYISLILFSITGIMIAAYLCFWILKEANISLFNLLLKSQIYLYYSIFFLCSIFAAKWALNLEPLPIVIIALFSIIIYYIVILRISGFNREIFSAFWDR